MKTNMYLKIIILVIGILAVTKISSAQFSFEVNLPGIRIVAGERYPVIIERPVVVYYEPLPQGRYYYDDYNDAFYTDEGYVYYHPSNVYYTNDNGKHKGWYKNGKNKHYKKYKYKVKHNRNYYDDD